ncbi:hypothetical protein K438DRAFT_1890600 [Mycena galopus ATCC 62051]|nr:hypothetical protein K438DRAFT_1890600 [Mycena galopus ATCC 62051]
MLGLSRAWRSRLFPLRLLEYDSTSDWEQQPIFFDPFIAFNRCSTADHSSFRRFPPAKEHHSSSGSRLSETRYTLYSELPVRHRRSEVEKSPESEQNTAWTFFYAPKYFKYECSTPQQHPSETQKDPEVVLSKSNMQFISLLAFIGLATASVNAAAAKPAASTAGVDAAASTASINATVAKPVALTPSSVAAAGLTNINDFQGNGLNLVNNAAVGPGDGTTVNGLSVGFSGQANQQWTFITSGSGFQIANGLNPSLFLSYPAAAFNGNPFGAAVIVYSEFPTTFTLQPLTPPAVGFNIVEPTGLLLTSWALVPGNTAGQGVGTAPVTLEPRDPNLTSQQTWQIVAAPA